MPPHESARELVVVAVMRGLVPALHAVLRGDGTPVAILDAARSTHVEVISSDAARHGVRVGMSRAEAKRKVPEVRFVGGGREVAGRVAASLAKELATFSPAVELVREDALVIRLGRVSGPTAGHRVAQWLIARIGSRFSRRPRIGIGPNVLVARAAARTADGGGIVSFDIARYREAVGGWRVRELPGVSPRLERRLHARGVYTIAQLASAAPQALGLGAAGNVLCRRARGESLRTGTERRRCARAASSAGALPTLRVGAGSFEGEAARAVERVVRGELGARIRARLLREGRNGEWMVIPVEGLRRSA
jgi:DNA polymerase-4